MLSPGGLRSTCAGWGSRRVSAGNCREKALVGGNLRADRPFDDWVGSRVCELKVTTAMADRQDNLKTNGDGHEEPVRGASHDHAAAHAAGGLPREAGDEFEALVRELDRVGRSHRARLSQEAEERIFAASDLQLPLAADAVSPVLGRIGSHIGALVSGKTVSGKTVSGKTVSGSVAASRARSIPRTMPWLRVAAAIAVVGGVAALAVVFARSNATDQPMAPGEVLVDGRSAVPSTSSNANASASGSASGSSPSGSPTTRADDVLARVPTSEHFERALVDLHPSRSSAMQNERSLLHWRNLGASPTREPRWNRWIQKPLARCETLGLVKTCRLRLLR